MRQEKDTSTGRYRESFRDEVFLKAFEQGSVLSTKEVADKVGCSYNLAYKRLGELAEEGRIKGKIIGNSCAWWI
jgi:ribosomal protein S25